MDNNLIEPIRVDADYDELAYILGLIEESYNIKFEKNELKEVRTFGELCGHILSKIKLEEVADCTDQQAFYKLRDGISIIAEIPKESIQLNTQLSLLFPVKGRIKQIKKLETHLGYKLHILRPNWLSIIILVVLIFASLFYLRFDWRFGVYGIIAFIVLTLLIFKTASIFDVITVGELAEKMTREHYLKSRRNGSTVNRKEIVKQIEKLFIDTIAIDLKEIKPETLIF